MGCENDGADGGAVKENDSETKRDKAGQSGDGLEEQGVGR